MRAGFVFVCLGMLAVPAYAQDLPPGPGADVVARVCSGCHGLDQVTSERHTADGWNDVVNAMVGNGASATDDEQNQIVNYLAANYGSPGAPALAPAPGAPALAPAAGAPALAPAPGAPAAAPVTPAAPPEAAPPAAAPATPTPDAAAPAAPPAQ
jgi:hypothetical protein